MSCSIGIRIIIWIYLLNITAVEVRGQVPLPNAVIRINGQTMLDCHTTANDLPLSYWRHSPNGNSLITISVGCNPSAGYDPAYYRTELIGGNICRLTIANVTMQQAGVYLCFDGANVIYRSLVTVIEPVASVVVNNRSEVVEGDQLSISCSISYNGPASPAPSLRPLPYWTTSPGQIYTNDIDRPSTNIVTLTATVTVQKPIVPVFQCGTVFETTGNTSGYNAIPPPDNFTLGSTTELDVQYTPSAPVISSRPEIIAIDGVSCGISVLTCSSMGNPVPNYRWFESEENVILSNTNILTLAEVKRTYICEAYNTIRNNMSSTSATTTVLTDNCTFTAGQLCCVFPRDEATSVTVEGCNNGTLCDCSNGTSGIRLICNATTFPTAFYMWSGPGITQPIDSAVCDTVTQNGVFLCTAYFNKALSNYTGDVPFSNGTNETNVGLCCATWVLVISFVIPYIGGNLIFLGAFLVPYFKLSDFKSLMDNKFPGTTTLTIVFLIASVFFGLIIIPIVVTMAFCSSLKQVGDVSSKPGGSIQMDGIPERSGSRQENGDSSAEVRNQQGGNVANAGPGIPVWSIVVMWCVGIVLLFPITFVCVYFVPCNQMRFEIS